jgi:hypothetical protein
VTVGQLFDRTAARFPDRPGLVVRHEGRGFEATLKLCDAAQAEILTHCGEPDPVEQSAPLTLDEEAPPMRMLG